jgi:hypothetical protein
MRKDRDLLEDELKDDAKKVVFSAEMATAAVGLLGSFFHPTLGLAAAGGALYRKKVEYRAARNKTLEGHTITLDQKRVGKPIAGNRHDGFDEAGAGNRLTVRLLRHSERPTRLQI